MSISNTRLSKRGWLARAAPDGLASDGVNLRAAAESLGVLRTGCARQGLAGIDGCPPASDRFVAANSDQ
jgi:hypothetical protein